MDDNLIEQAGTQALHCEVGPEDDDILTGCCGGSRRCDEQDLRPATVVSSGSLEHDHEQPARHGASIQRFALLDAKKPPPEPGASVALEQAALAVSATANRPALLGLPCHDLAPATLIFGAVAFIAIAAGSEVGSNLVAVGLLAHTVWDLVHLRARAIVSPSLAEWCAVLETLIAVGILVLVWR